MSDSLPLNRLNLQFSGKWHYLEESYNSYYQRKSLVRNRYTVLISLFFYLFFGLLDRLILPDYAELFGFIRFLIITPVTITVFILTFYPFYEKIAHLLLFLLSILGGVGIIAMIGIGRSPLIPGYYAGVILVILTTNFFYQIPFRWSMAASMIITLLYELTLFHFTDTSKELIIANNFFYITFLLISSSVSYLNEYNQRQQFYQGYLLSQEKIKGQYQKQKLEELGTLSAGIAHDFNNILTAIMGYTELALDETDKDSDVHKFQKEVLLVSQKGKSMTQQILSYSRKENSDLSVFSLNDSILEALNLMKTLFPSKIHVTTSLKSPSFIRANPTQIHRVIINLCTNSIHAMEKDGGELILSTENLRWKDINEEHRTILIPAEYIKFNIADRGIGIDESIIDKIFTPFFTTKESMYGTGLGLSVVREIVRDLNGGIFIHSEKGKGTLLTLYFPIHS